MTTPPDETEPSTPTVSFSPTAYYQARAGERERTLLFWRRRDGWLASLRLLTFAVGVGLAIAAFGDGVLGTIEISPVHLTGPAFLFALLILLHDRVIRQRVRAERALAYYESAQRHLLGDWRTSQNRGEREFATDHPYAADLDLYGSHSLFQRLARIQTEPGNRALANLLSKPPSLAVARDRQAAVRSLQERVCLREDLYVAADEAGLDNTRAALAWVRKSRPAPSAVHHVIAVLFSAASLWGLSAAYAERIPWLWCSLPLGLQSMYGVWMKQRLAGVRSEAERAKSAIRALVAMSERLEREPFDVPLLQGLQGQLLNTEQRASGEMRQLLRWMEWEEDRRNLFFAPIAALLLWGTQFSIAIERWRHRFGPALIDWFEVVGAFEAHCAIAAYAFERPDDVFPSFEDGPVQLRGRQLAHPLIDPAVATRNDLDLHVDTPLWVISGSNMSGKSTWLRTIGVNVVLAWLGAPVCAQELRLSEFRLGATLRIQDSLAEGESRFYAEIARIHALMGLAERESPLLFLLDEILAGTNSHDRAVGAKAILRELVRFGAVGLVTTHDLALTQLADAWGERALNWHFEDRLEHGRLAFDYRLKPGIVARSNAIELMQAIGLKVSRDESVSPAPPLVHPNG